MGVEPLSSCEDSEDGFIQQRVCRKCGGSALDEEVVSLDGFFFRAKRCLCGYILYGPPTKLDGYLRRKDVSSEMRKRCSISEEESKKILRDYERRDGSGKRVKTISQLASERGVSESTMKRYIRNARSGLTYKDKKVLGLSDINSWVDVSEEIAIQCSFPVGEFDLIEMAESYIKLSKSQDTREDRARCISMAIIASLVVFSAMGEDAHDAMCERIEKLL